MVDQAERRGLQVALVEYFYRENGCFARGVAAVVEDGLAQCQVENGQLFVVNIVLTGFAVVGCGVEVPVGPVLAVGVFEAGDFGAVERIGGVKLAVCPRQDVDGDTLARGQFALNGQYGIAALLGPSGDIVGGYFHPRGEVISDAYIFHADIALVRELERVEHIFAHFHGDELCGAFAQIEIEELQAGGVVIVLVDGAVVVDHVVRQVVKHASRIVAGVGVRAGVHVAQGAASFVEGAADFSEVDQAGGAGVSFYFEDDLDAERVAFSEGVVVAVACHVAVECPAGIVGFFKAQARGQVVDDAHLRSAADALVENVYEKCDFFAGLDRGGLAGSHAQREVKELVDRRGIGRLKADIEAVVALA